MSDRVSNIAKLLNAVSSLKTVNCLFLELLLDTEDRYVYEYAYSLFFLVTALEPRRILNLGTGGKGISLRAMLAGLLHNNRGGCITTVEKKDYGQQGRDLENKVRLLAPECMVAFATCDDLQLEITEWFDLVFLDTSHDYEHTLDELYKFSAWTDLIVCHDTKLEGVRRAIEAFLDTHADWNNVEIGSTPMGLGILYRLAD
jgi:predicted O-methyltransferase YrrM